MMTLKKIPSPLGRLQLAASPKGLTAVLWENMPAREVETADNSHILREAAKQLQAYFQGNLKQFDLPLDMQGQGTDFQRQVWQALQPIPYGKTVSYLDIAKKIGNPSAVRAVGAAIGRNPLAIVVPCHRVIGANGKLTGFAGGLDAKTFLLARA